ncbi:MAG: colanic acid biosynthesis acetyltransferase WcaF [Gammaproteobacteria bacterium]|nr:colanic acid biosynthesis acetyltransferase WcaF [Gammaproteobacteria bacterium]
MNTATDNSTPTPDLARYQVTGYTPGAGAVKRLLWYFINALVFDSPLFPVYGFKRWLLRVFGARIGTGVVIKPNVNIKYPWRLSIDRHSWIGEGAWIDNLADVSIAANVCVSQGAYLLTGNHDYKSVHFTLITRPIVLQEGVWVSAKAIVCPGVAMARNSILTVGSVLTSATEPNGIYVGNPAKWVKARQIG